MLRVLNGTLVVLPALCSTPPSWPHMIHKLQTCASARPQTARPPCWSQPARTATSKPGSSPHRRRVRPPLRVLTAYPAERESGSVASKYVNSFSSLEFFYFLAEVNASDGRSEFPPSVVPSCCALGSPCYLFSHTTNPSSDCVLDRSHGSSEPPVHLSPVCMSVEQRGQTPTPRGQNSKTGPKSGANIDIY